MRRSHRLSIAVAAAVLALGQWAAAQAILIDFDTDPSGNDPGGMNITQAYAAWGIHFLPVGAHTACNSVYANTNHPGDFGSPPNLISLCPPPTASDISENAFGLIQVWFDAPVTGVCIDVRPNHSGASGDRAVLRAYDAGGGLIQESISSPGAMETLCVNGLRIKTVEFSGYGDEWARFDNLSVVMSAGAGPFTTYVPGAANLPGTAGTTWRTDLEVVNTASYDVNCTVELLERDAANPSPASASFTVGPGEARRTDNALATLFGYSGAATLRVSGLQGPLLTTARTYNDDPSGTFGQYIRGLWECEGIGPGQTGTLVQLSQSASDTTGYRTNLGLVSASGFPVAVDVQLYSENGSLLGSRRYTLEPYESIQVNRVFLEVAGSAVSDGYIVVSSPTTEALFHAYASVVDNRSGDAVYVPAAVQ